jgi:hypothetical protein
MMARNPAAMEGEAAHRIWTVQEQDEERNSRFFNGKRTSHMDRRDAAPEASVEQQSAAQRLRTQQEAAEVCATLTWFSNGGHQPNVPASL